MNKITYFRKRIQDHCANGQWSEAVAPGEALLSEHFTKLTHEGLNAGYADDLFNLARIYEETGGMERAAQLYAESANRVLAQKGECMALANRFTNLGAVCHKKGTILTAYNMYWYAVNIARKSCEKDSLELADVLYNLANAAADIGNHDEALQLHMEALPIYETAGPDTDIVNCMHSIAFVWEAKKEIKKAIPFAVSAMERAAGTDAFYSACYYLAELYDQTEEHEQATPLYKTVLHWVQETEGREHSSYITVAARLARSLAGTGARQEALTLANEVRVLTQHAPAGDFMGYAGCLRRLALLYRQFGDLDSAVDMMLKSMRVKRRVMAEYARAILADVVFLTEIYLERDRYQEALAILVYLLMCTDGQNLVQECTDELNRILTQSGRGKFKTVLDSMEDLNESGRLPEIMMGWREWEQQE